MDARLIELRSRKRKLNDMLGDIRHEAQLSMKKSRTVWTLPRKVVDVALLVYVLSGYCLSASVQFLRAYGLRRKWPERSTTDLGAFVEAQFLGADLATLASLSDIEGPTDISALNRALAYIRELDLLDWVKSLNMEKGVAPSSAMLVDRAVQKGLRPPSTNAIPRAGMRLSMWGKKWARRWRQKWKARIGSLKAREWISAEEAQNKVIIPYFAFRASDCLLRGGSANPCSSPRALCRRVAISFPNKLVVSIRGPHLHNGMKHPLRFREHFSVLESGPPSGPVLGPRQTRIEPMA